MVRFSLAKSLCLVAFLATAPSAFAGLLDGTVLINRAANNKSVAVSYDGVRASLVELRINGESVSSRTVSEANANGEAKFALNPALLKDGENLIEVRLFDEKGKLVASENSKVTIDRRGSGVVAMKGPKSGSTIVGPIQLEVELRQDLKDIYVSFFVDEEFKSIRNFPPHSYVWDTTRETNGWHEIQAWVVDKDNNTHKTEKVRLYVNNPNGRTVRNPPINGKNLAVADTAATTSPSSGFRAAKGSTASSGDLASTVTEPSSRIALTKSEITEPGLKPVAEKSPVVLATTVSESSTVSKPLGTKSPVAEKGSITGQRLLLPTGNRAIDPEVSVRGSSANEPSEPKSLALREIAVGARLFEETTFSVYLNGKPLTFDVAPRVVDGVPFTPFRHLFESAGGEVRWIHDTKSVEADGMGNSVRFTIGALSGTNNGATFSFERASFLESGRTIVPLSFVNSTLDIKVQYDPNTGHVLISNSKSK